MGMIRLELPEYGVRAKNLGQHNRARKARQQWGERRSIVRGSKDGIRKGSKGTKSRILDRRKIALGLPKFRIHTKRNRISEATRGRETEEKMEGDGSNQVPYPSF